MPGGQNPATHTQAATGRSAGKSRSVHRMTATATPAQPANCTLALLT
jgi:predicted DNA-binding protein with PD1-like motif